MRATAGFTLTLGQSVPRPEIADLLLRGFAEVQTGHDLRGFGLMTGTALSGGGGDAS